MLTFHWPSGHSAILADLVVKLSAI